MTFPHSVVRFAEWEFDVDTGELVGPAGAVRLQPQPAKVLAALLARPGDLVTRDELKRALWPDTVVEADQGLNFCVRQIRAALGDEADAGRFIETLPRRGYRLVVPVRPADEQPPVASDPLVKPAVRRSWRTIGLTTVGLLVVTAALSLQWVRGSGVRPATRKPRLAVIPFVAPPGERWMVELNRDLTDHLVARLTVTDSGRIGVVGPVTTRQYAGDTRPHTEIGAKLGVDVVVSGGIRSTDSTLFVQGIRVSDGTHVVVWRQKVFQRSAEEIVASIVAAIAGKI
jgi:DNA-binding winged helix-turn-helix (wHTH) protein/TolB-like protein